ncbi:hypothetical protein CBS147346_5413 [Aspergillus niger]|nr:hypothetical protein CBS147346_5413 [Aspergillus niger]
MTMAKRRRSTLELDEAATVTELKDDANQKAVHDAYLGTIAFDVRFLDTETYTNRELDMRHVGELIASFKLGVRRFFRETRMKACMKQDDYKSSSRPMLVQLLVQRLSIWREAKRPSLTAGSYMILRSALSTLLAEQEKAATEGGLTPDGSPLLHPSPQAYYWAFDIYEQEKMESDLLATLKGNRDDPNKSDSDGYVLISILDDLAAKTENERQQLLKAGNFGPWLQSTYGLNRSQGPRVLAITTAPFWRDLWRSYVMTPYGEKYFNFTTAGDIASTKLEKLWAREIDFVLTFGDRIFEGKKVTSADWETVLAAMEKGPRADFLRRLFFPTKADHEDGSLTGLLSLNQKWFNQWTLPRLAGDTFTTGSTQVNTRRPGFLAKLSDVEYHKAFINMQQNPGLTCPRWSDFVRTNRLIAQPMKKVLQHVIYWTDQSFSYPRSSSNALKNWDWVEELGKSAFRAEVNPRPWRHVGEGSTDIQPKFTITSLPDHIGKFMEQLWTYIETEPLWRDVTVVKQQLKLPTDKKQVSEEGADLEAMYTYLARFEQKNWAGVVKLVVGYAGPCLRGKLSMKKLQAFTSFGPLNVKVQMAENAKFRSVRYLTTQAIRNQLSDETELFSAMFCYRELKKVMISTLTHRYGGGSKRRSEQLSFLLDKKEWEVARAELIEYSMTLNWRGIMVNADQLNESLERLALPTHANPVAEDGQPIMGFLKMDPESYGLEQQGNTERLQELLARTLDKEIDSL